MKTKPEASEKNQMLLVSDSFDFIQPSLSIHSDKMLRSAQESPFKPEQQSHLTISLLLRLHLFRFLFSIET